MQSGQPDDVISIPGAPPSISSRAKEISPFLILQSMMLAERMAAAIGKENVVLELFENVGHADAMLLHDRKCEQGARLSG